MSQSQTFIILGGSGHARETALHLLDINPQSRLVFLDEFPKAATLELRGSTYPILSNWADAAKISGARFIVGVGVPSVKKIMVQKALAKGLVPAATQVHPTAVVQNAELGLGGMIAPGAVVTTNVKIGDYVVLNTNCTVGHDAVIGDFVTCNPGSNVSGNTTLGSGVYFGVGAATKEGVSIAPDCTVGGKAFVHKSVSTPGVTLVGVPAAPLMKGVT